MRTGIECKRLTWIWLLLKYSPHQLISLSLMASPVRLLFFKRWWGGGFLGRHSHLPQTSSGAAEEAAAAHRPVRRSACRDREQNIGSLHFWEEVCVSSRSCLLTGWNKKSLLVSETKWEPERLAKLYVKVRMISTLCVFRISSLVLKCCRIGFDSDSLTQSIIAIIRLHYGNYAHHRSCLPIV